MYGANICQRIWLCTNLLEAKSIELKCQILGFYKFSKDNKSEENTLFIIKQKEKKSIADVWRNQENASRVGEEGWSNITSTNPPPPLEY